ncbi:MAG: hypothetical protein V4666_07520 [Bacteroidota bacterium]
MNTKSLTLIILLTLLLSCSDKKTNVGFEINATAIVHGDGDIVSICPFQLSDSKGNRIITEKGIVGVNVLKPLTSSLMEKDFLVFSGTKAILVIDHPTKKFMGYHISNKKGFTRKQIVFLLNDIYTEIYKTADNKSKKYIENYELNRVCQFNKNGEIYLIVNCDWDK